MAQLAVIIDHISIFWWCRLPRSFLLSLTTMMVLSLLVLAHLTLGWSANVVYSSAMLLRSHGWHVSSTVFEVHGRHVVLILDVEFPTFLIMLISVVHLFVRSIFMDLLLIGITAASATDFF